jgi:hypothetical protein
MKPSSLLPIVALALAALAGQAIAQVEAPWLSEAEIRAALAGQTIDGRYPEGETFTETYEAGGKVRYRDGRHTTAGRWSIIEGTLCTIYDNDPTGGCFRVQRTSANCFEFYFVARTEYEASRPREPDWSAQGWLSDRVSTCAVSDSV